MLRPVTAVSSSKSSNCLCLLVILFFGSVVVWCVGSEVWASLPQHCPVLLCLAPACAHNIAPSLISTPGPPLVWLGAEKLGCMSMCHWGPRSSHECGPQLATQTTLVICLIVFRTKKEFCCDRWVSVMEDRQCSVSPRWLVPLWSLAALGHTYSLCTTSHTCCLCVQYCLTLG